DPEQFDRLAREQRDVDVHDRGIARLDPEGVSAGKARAVEQGVRHDLAGPRRRALQPEGAKARELLLLGQPGVDRDTARPLAVALTAPERAKVARAEKHRELVQMVR